ncbi:MAG: HAD-IIIC family phosphatase, partial [Magnetococcales bacterium]|nr:HAD-IIIC family phosphatase [Magnetococcales bacterium]
MKKDDIKQILPMTPMQEGMLFHALHDTHSNPYFEQCQFRLRGHMEPDRFEAAWNEVMRRHDALRTRFVFKNIQNPRQVILKEQKILFLDNDLSHLTPKRQQEIIENYKQEDRERGFDLSREVLMRMAVFRLDADTFEVIHSFHHIVLDGWSVGIIHEESFQIYAALQTNTPHRLPPPVPIARYLQWLDRQDKNASERYWSRLLTGYRRPVPLPGCRPTAPDAPFLPEERHYPFSAELTAAIKQLAARHRVTLNAVIQSVWGLLLGAYRRADDVVFAATVSGRPPEIPDVERMVGLFINAIPIRVRLEPGLPFHRLLRRVQQEATASQEHHHHSLAEIQANTPLGPALLDHILVFENYASAELNRFAIPDGQGGTLVVEQYQQQDHSNYPLTVQVIPGKTLAFNMILNQAAIDPAQVDEMITNLQGILSQVTSRDDLPPEAITLTIPSRFATSPDPLPDAPQESRNPHALSLLIAATFTADPIAPHLRWWGHAFGIPIETRFAPYNQIFQELLNPASQLATHAGPALLLIRFEDWIRHLPSGDIESGRAHLENSFTQLLQALDRHESTAPRLIGLLPLARQLPEMPDAVPVIAALDQRLRTHLNTPESPWQPLDLAEIPPLFGIDTLFDAQQDQVGHIPFSDPFHAAMGLWIARRLVALRTPPFKVIVLDCDNTLWQGVCGEGGSAAVVVTPGHRALQQFMVERQREGFLLTLNSKNNPEDVWEVFANHPGMVLRREQIVAERINWQPKSANLRALAQELNLGVESFLFLDDSGVECAEMMAHCPEALTLRLPDDPEDFALFLRHVWAFDRFGVTREDQQRSAMYQEERQRKRHQESSDSLESFLQTLEIQVFMEPIRTRHLPRVSQLTQRTNQFNLSTIRRSEAELAALLDRPEWQGWCVHVQDRFGDYGLVGVVLAEREASRMKLDTFLLSCRVLGRGVEFAILSGLREHARQLGVTRLVAEYRPTAKNPPIRAFLEQSPLREESTTEAGTLFGADCDALPATAAHARLSLEAPPVPEESPAANPTACATRSETAAGSAPTAPLAAPPPAS